MRAIILAGGRGSRLDPLTRHLPKPLVPFFGRPLIVHQIQWLATHGFTDIVVSLGHFGSLIENALGPAQGDAQLTYVYEESPLGTAGATVHALAVFRNQPPEPILVIPGDCLADFDLRALYHRFCRMPESFGMVVRNVHDARQFGAVEVRDGRINRLIEKSPAMDGCHLVNTGIYLLKADAPFSWPTIRPLDFAFDVFPALIRDGSLAALQDDGYWSDLGTLNQYRQSHFDALAGHVQVDRDLPGGEHVTIDHSARILGPVWFGDHVTIDAHASVGPYAVVGTGTYVGPWSHIEHVVIGRGAFLGAGTRIHDATIDDRVAIGGRCRIGSQSAVGADSRIGWGTDLRPGSRLAPLTRVAPVAHSEVHRLTAEGSYANS